ncbi:MULTISPECIES: YggT family protein [Sphingomonas]|uniref:YggT family protein n=1 Tax=Sphingomonas TaxID=13687 RepID=UPI000DEEDD9D|nr:MULTISPECIES: YggT family protein [Sphingomonas]
MLLIKIILDVAVILLNVLWWIVVIQVVLSWLVAFNVLNTSSEGVRRFLVALDRFMAPLYRPIRRILPDFGGLDLSPIVLILIITILQGPVIGNIRNALQIG